MKSIEIEARAKINWSLAVTGKRADGYHELDMLLQSISLSDRVKISTGNGFGLYINGKKTDNPVNNLCYKAAQAFYSYVNISPACEIYLSKHIPICAGMGGGSADAAATLIGLNMLHACALKPEVLKQIGLKLGADVPFMLSGGLMRARGIGEQLQSCHLGCGCYFVGLMPYSGAATREIFARFDLNSGLPAFNNDELASALSAGDIYRAAPLMVNHLQPVTEGINPEISRCINELKDSGAVAALMTGSGSASYGVYTDRQAADSAYFSLRQKHAYRVFRFSSRSRSLNILSVK